MTASEGDGMDAACAGDGMDAASEGDGMDAASEGDGMDAACEGDGTDAACDYNSKEQLLAFCKTFCVAWCTRALTTTQQVLPFQGQTLDILLPLVAV